MNKKKRWNICLENIPNRRKKKLYMEEEKNEDKWKV
jgi:hypothetical protein